MPSLIPDLSSFSELLIATDYSGGGDRSVYNAISILIVGTDDIVSWDSKRLDWRQKILPDNRRISYKDLNDKFRRKILYPFLNIASGLHGIVVTILIDKKIDSIFTQSGYVGYTGDFAAYSTWKPATFEKLLRVSFFIVFLLDIFSSEGQNVIWITDEDDIVANQSMMEQIPNLLNNISSHHLHHRMGSFAIGTTKSDDGSLQIEDLVAISDLTAGALSEIITKYRTNSILPNTLLLVPPPSGIISKARIIWNWLSNYSEPLKRLVYVIQFNSYNSELVLLHLRLLSTRDL